MTVGVILFFVVFALAPTLMVAFGFTTLKLEDKHRIGDLSNVEFSKHQMRTIQQYECNEKELEKELSDTLK